MALQAQRRKCGAVERGGAAAWAEEWSERSDDESGVCAVAMCYWLLSACFFLFCRHSRISAIIANYS